VKRAYAQGMSLDASIEAVTAALASGGLSADAVAEGMPPELVAMLPAEAAERLPELVRLYLTAMVAQDAYRSAQTPPLEIGGQVFVREMGGLPTVWAIAMPLDPERTIARFAAACYRTFPAESFARSPHGVRDARWFMQNQDGESYRSIALSDPEAGLPPEVRANPGEYPHEVKRGAARVAKAVQRLRKGWTRLGDFVSTESGDAG